MFLVNVEVSIVGTALVPIVEDLKGVERMGWVITGYLITYTGRSRARHREAMINMLQPPSSYGQS
jgi:hypothetical protein